MSHSLIPSLDIVRRTLAAEISYTISRMQVLERLPGNPLAIAYRWIDDEAVALMSRLPAFCRVVGMRAGHAPQLGSLLLWYRQHGLRPTFEAVPGMYDAALGRELARLGLFQSGFHASLIGKPTSAPASGAAGIERVSSAAALEDYLEAYVAGWGIAEADRAQFKRNVRPWLGQAGAGQAAPGGRGDLVPASGRWLSRRCRDGPGIPATGPATCAAASAFA